MANAKGGKGRKIGRNAAKCKAYKDRGIRELNKARKAARRIKGLRKGVTA